MAVVALAMTSKEVEELEKAFRALDKDNRGTIQVRTRSLSPSERTDLI